MGDTAVTILCDNEGSKGLKTEHGLALLVERPDGALLADCGASGAFIDNARSLGRDLSAVRAVTLSHNHFDHTRGFLSFTEAYSHEYTLWLSSHFFKTSAWRKESDRGALTPTSGPITAASLCKDNVNFKLVGEDVFELPSLSGVYLMCNIPRSISFETADERDLICRDGEWQTDDYRDELAVIIQTDAGLLLLAGCAHVGLCNMTKCASERFGAPVSAVIGGAHLVPYGAERAELTANYLKTAGVRSLVACHCTGELGFASLGRQGFEKGFCGRTETF